MIGIQKAIKVGNKFLGSVTGYGSPHDVSIVVRLLDDERKVNIIFFANDSSLKLCLRPSSGVIAGERKRLQKSLDASIIAIEKSDDIMSV